MAKKTTETPAPVREPRNRKTTMEVAGRTPYKESLSEIRRINPGDIVLNSSNPRKPLPKLYEMGYDLFVKRADSNKDMTLREMALSDDADLRKQFCKLIEDFEATRVADEEGSSEMREGIPHLADSLVMHGWINPVTVRVIRDDYPDPELHGLYDLVAGARRYVALLYLNAKKMQEAPVFAVVRDFNSEPTRASSFALDENLTVRPMGPADIIRQVGELTQLGFTPEQLAGRFRTNVRTIERRLNAAQAGEDMIVKFERGEIGLVDLEKIGQRIKSGQSLEEAKEGIVNRPNSRAAKRAAKSGGNGRSGGGGGRTTAEPAAKKVTITAALAYDLYCNDESMPEVVRKWFFGYFGGWGKESVFRTREQMEIEREATR